MYGIIMVFKVLFNEANLIFIGISFVMTGDF